jgi:hypothetical protein
VGAIALSLLQLRSLFFLQKLSELYMKEIPLVNLNQKFAVTTISVALFCVALNIRPKSSLAFTVGGEVLPASTTVNGYSLTDAATAIAPYQDTFDPAYLPSTPFQLLTLAASSYTVTNNTYFYLPLSSVNDSPPILGTFPSTPSEAQSYWFDSSQIGASGFKITVDGKETALGSEYLAGPVNTPLPLGGQHSLVFAAFLSPLTEGQHTINFKNAFNGELIGGPCAPDACFTSDVTYAVHSKAAEPVPEPSEIAASVFASAFLLWQVKKRQKQGLRISS